MSYQSTEYVDFPAYGQWDYALRPGQEVLARWSEGNDRGEAIGIIKAVWKKTVWVQLPSGKRITLPRVWFRCRWSLGQGVFPLDWEERLAKEKAARELPCPICGSGGGK